MESRSLPAELHVRRAKTPLASVPLSSPPDELAAFSPESVTKRSPPSSVFPSSMARLSPAAIRNAKWVLAGLGITVAAIAAVMLFTQYRAAARNADFGKLTIDSRPQGLKVVLDGEERGVTPFTIMLKPGAHGLGLLNGTERRSLPITITAGVEVSQYFEFTPTAPVAVTGVLSVTSDVPGSRISVDGRPRGTAPLIISDLPAGEHTVTLAAETGTIERRVSLEPGTTASVVFSTPKGAGPSAGWVAIAAPFDVQIYEGSDLIGTGASAKIMLPVGRHDIRLASQALGYADMKHIDVGAGKTTTVKVDAPKAVVSANARPWADVLIDGVNVGQTPLANLSVTVGSHEVVFRHPQYGERRQTMVVTVGGPNRISVDLTRQ